MSPKYSLVRAEALAEFQAPESDVRVVHILVERDSDLIFQAYTTQELNRGRWMVLDAWDLDGDDDVDIILGAATTVD